MKLCCFHLAFCLNCRCNFVSREPFHVTDLISFELVFCIIEVLCAMLVLICLRLLKLVTCWVFEIVDTLNYFNCIVRTPFSPRVTFWARYRLSLWTPLGFDIYWRVGMCETLNIGLLSSHSCIYSLAGMGIDG